MVRAAIPERIVMQMAGHKTRAIFDRYQIVADSDLRDAVDQLNNTFGRRTATALATVAAGEQSVSALTH